MSDDIKRREFLDELFTFMQKRGKLVTSFSVVDRWKEDAVFSLDCILTIRQLHAERKLLSYIIIKFSLMLI